MAAGTHTHTELLFKESYCSGVNEAFNPQGRRTLHQARRYTPVI